MVPSFGSLLQTIQSLVEATHLMFLTWFQKTSWLSYIDFLLQLTIEKSYSNVQLMHFPSKMCPHCSSQPNSYHSRSGSKSLLKFYTLLLSIAFGNKASFQIINRSINFPLDFVNPSSANCLFTNGQIHQIPGLILLNRRNLFLHGLHPIWINLSLFKRLWLICILQTWKKNERRSKISRITQMNWRTRSCSAQQWWR